MCAQPVVAVPLQLALFLGIILCIQLAFATAFVVKFRLRQPPLCGCWTEAHALRVCTGQPRFTRAVMNRGTQYSLRQRCSGDQCDGVDCSQWQPIESIDRPK